MAEVFGCNPDESGGVKFQEGERVRVADLRRGEIYTGFVVEDSAPYRKLIVQLDNGIRIRVGREFVNRDHGS